MHTGVETEEDMNTATTAEPAVFPAKDLPLTSECHHYEDSDEMPPHLAKYWHQRYNIFSLYDFDIYLTDDAWFGVTPEPIALQVAADLASKSISTHHPHQPRVIIDMFAGAGGNTIAFARHVQEQEQQQEPHRSWTHVVAIERDAATLACAQHNARVYGVAEHITWVHADCLDVLGRLARAPWTLSPDLLLRLWGGDAASLSPEAWVSSWAAGDGNRPWLRTLARQFELFASPPWGGPQYADFETMDLNAMEPYGVDVLHAEFTPFAHAMFLPRNGDLRQLADLVPDDDDDEHDDPREKLDVVQYLINGASKGLVAYYPVDHTIFDDDSNE